MRRLTVMTETFIHSAASSSVRSLPVGLVSADILVKEQYKQYHSNICKVHKDKIFLYQWLAMKVSTEYVALSETPSFTAFITGFFAPGVSEFSDLILSSSCDTESVAGRYSLVFCVDKLQMCARMELRSFGA